MTTNVNLKVCLHVLLIFCTKDIFSMLKDIDLGAYVALSHGKDTFPAVVVRLKLVQIVHVLTNNIIMYQRYRRW